MQSSTWRWRLDEAFAKINGERHYLWRLVDREGEVLESYVTKKRDKKAALKFIKSLYAGIDRPMRLLQIGFDPTVQQQKSFAVQVRKLHSGGQTTERRIHTYPFADEHVRCWDLGVCTASKNLPQSTPHFTITSIHKDPSPSAVLLSLAVTLLLQSGTLF